MCASDVDDLATIKEIAVALRSLVLTSLSNPHIRGELRLHQSTMVNDSDSRAQVFVANAHMADIENHEWIIDSGAGKHMLCYCQEFETPEPVGLGDGSTVSALGTGKVKFISYLPNNRKVVCMDG